MRDRRPASPCLVQPARSDPEDAMTKPKFGRRKFPALHTRNLTLIALFPAEVTMPDWVNNEQGVT